LTGNRDARSTIGAASGPALDHVIGFVGKGLGTFASRFITQEHVCDPPQSVVGWVPVATRACGANSYVCPECGQRFLPKSVV